MMNEDLVKQVAASVWRRVAAEGSAHVPPEPDLSRLTSALPTPIQSRERRAEAADLSSPAAFFAPWTGAVFQPLGSAAVYPPQPRIPADHPSQEPFNVTEAAEIKSAVNELVEFFESQRCSIEKDKGCDHCGACRSLGF